MYHAKEREKRAISVFLKSPYAYNISKSEWGGKVGANVL